MSPQHPPNRLIHEKSPYLLQHAHNPVDWRPWGDEAFADARRLRRPVFLSIGYSTCHWCHVMERESFEDEEVARLLNARFVPVKVDREERPDVDQVYMRVCQALHGRGGWPLTALLTPEGNPFFAATYLPKTSRGGRAGLMELLQGAADLWEAEGERVSESAQQLTQRLAHAYAPRPPGVPDPGVFARAVGALESLFDARFGGFGGAPKFPAPHQLVFLLRRHRATGEPGALAMARRTLDAISAGGIRDHLGGGYHRYSTDARWFSPHFEKMLYDQAGLALAFLELFQATGSPEYARRVKEILDYVSRDLSAPAGGFYCGEDADAEGEEGRFHTWTHRELLDLLGEEDGKRFADAYGARPEGNFVHEATGQPTGRNILFLPLPASGPVDEPLPEAKALLFQAREKRIRPHCDDKVLAGWTAYMASAFARAGTFLEVPAWTARAERALSFVETHMTSEGRLLRRHREGEAAIGAFAEDFSYLARAWLDMHAATFDPAHLDRARHWANELFTRFGDGRGGLADTAADAEPLLFRPAEAVDGAMPSAASVGLEVAARLSLLTHDPAWEQRAAGLAASEASLVNEHPTAFLAFLAGAALVWEPARSLTITGDPAHPRTREFLRIARTCPAPETVARWEPQTGGEPHALLCGRDACAAPLDDPEALRLALAGPPDRG